MGNQTQDPNRQNQGKPGSQGGSVGQQNRPDDQDDNTIERRSSDTGEGREQQAGAGNDDELDKDDEDMEVSGDGTQQSRDRNQANRSSNR